MTPEPKLLETVHTFDNDTDGNLVIGRHQEIPQEHLDALRRAKDDTVGRPMGNLHRFASIPVAVYETWLRDGFDAAKESPKAIIRRLQAEHLDAFITTTKTL